MKPFVVLVLVVAPLHSFAARADATSPSTAGLGGAPITGLCMFSRPAVFANSKVGIAASARLKDLAQQAEAELAPDRKALEAERQSLIDQGTKLNAADRQARSQGLEQHAHALQAKVQLLTREIEATRIKAMEQIGATLQPIVAQINRTRGCGLLLDRGSVLGGNMSNDLTPQVVQALDAKISSITFDRAILAGEEAGRP